MEKKFKILLWDLDATWGRTSQGYTRSYNKTNENNLFSRLLELNTNDFRNKVKNRWELLRSNQFSEATIKALFESNLNQLANYNAEELENTKWNSNFNIQAEKQYINSWISNRLIFLDNYFSNL